MPRERLPHTRSFYGCDNWFTIPSDRRRAQEGFRIFAAAHYRGSPVADAPLGSPLCGTFVGF